VKNSRPLILAVLVVAFFALGWWLATRGQHCGQGPAGTDNAGKVVAPETVNPNDSTSENDPSPQAVLGRLFAKLRAGGITPAELANFRRALLNADPAAAMAAMRKFLATGQDALTGETFTLAKGGSLGGAPTFRVLMLDLLGRIARDANSQDGAVAAKELLQTKTSADEWAIALRNIAWSSPGDRQMLADKTRELLAYQPWKMQPSAGYFEAFDVVVYLRDTTFIPSLSEMLSGEDPSLQRSAAVALDRLATMAPLEAMSFLNANRGELAQKPFLRADYFSKADFSVTNQRVAVEAYLSRPDVETKEKVKMLSGVASPGVFASDNLLTPVPDAEIPPARTAALRQSVGNWLASNRFPELTGALRQLQGRMEDE
jgi:hypothetical protein